MRQVLICISCETVLGPLKTNLSRFRSQLKKEPVLLSWGVLVMLVLLTYPREILEYKKKEKVPGTSKTVRAGKGTNTDHILIFLKNMLDVKKG
jgi:hypothetical protein